MGGSRLRALLIMLALRPGQVVPASDLIDGLWAGQAPNGAANALQALVSRLRRALLAQRARAVLPGFEVTAANDPAVTRICRALAGMPMSPRLPAGARRA